MAPARPLVAVADIRIQRLSAEHGSGLRARAALEHDVGLAVSRDEIHPHYQPLMMLAENRLVGFEILARWHHPVRGDVPPDTFIPVVETLGLINQMTDSLLRRACLDAKDWSPEITIALNVSPKHFRLTNPSSAISTIEVAREQGSSSHQTWLRAIALINHRGSPKMASEGSARRIGQQT